MSSNNPFDEPRNPFRRIGASTVTHRELHRVVLTDPLTGVTMLVGQNAEVVELDPETGAVQTQKTVMVLQTVDGDQVRDPATEPVYTCRVCGATPLSQYYARRCHQCGRITCVPDARTTLLPTGEAVYACRECHDAAARQHRWQWFLSLTP